MPPLLHHALDLVARGILSSDPPLRRTRQANHPTLLVSWWCTGSALVIILFRLAGRWVRSETLFTEDKVVALSIIPLMLRMGCAHVLLLFGTNNADSTGISVQGAQNRVVGSKVVLVSRILYALFIWLAKLAVAEFLRRLATAIWTKTYETVLRGIRWFLVVTFLAIVVATLAECHPFHQYWQVVPTPKPECRNGFAQVLTMGSADIITDIVLIAFPIPLILRSSMPVKRKIYLVFLFSLSIFLIAITAYRMYAIIDSRGRQQFRTLWASIEILAAAAVSNFLVLGSFIRDRGVKKTRYRPPLSTRNDSQSITESVIQQPSLTRKMTLQHWGSDEDLFRDIGCRVQSCPNPGESITDAAARTRQESDAVMLDPASHNKTNWLRPDGTSGSRDGSSSTLDSDTITVEKLTRSGDVSHHNSSSGPSSNTTNHNLDDISLSDIGNTLNELSHPAAPTVHTFDFATRYPPRDMSRGRSSVPMNGELVLPRHSLGGDSLASRSKSRVYTSSPGLRGIPNPPLLHHPDYTSYQRSGEDQPLGDAGGLLSASPAPVVKARRTSALSQVFEMTTRGRRSSSQMRTPVSPKTKSDKDWGRERADT